MRKHRVFNNYSYGSRFQGKKHPSIIFGSVIPNQESNRINSISVATNADEQLLEEIALKLQRKVQLSTDPRVQREYTSLVLNILDWCDQFSRTPRWVRVLIEGDRV